MGKYRYIVVSQQDTQVQTSGFHDLGSAQHVYDHLRRVIQFWGGEEVSSELADQPGLVVLTRFTSKHKLIMSIVRVW